MSHVATVDLEVKDMECLAKAAARCGLVMKVNQPTYRWYGRSVGDYPLPAGFAAEDLGRCEHALSIPGDGDAYEIGVVRRRDGKPGYCLLWDFFAGGYGLQAKVGENCAKLKQAYAAEVAIRQARMQGYRVNEQQQADGSLRLTLSK